MTPGAKVVLTMLCSIAHHRDGWNLRSLLNGLPKSLYLPSTCHLEGSKLLIFDGHNSHLSTQIVDLAVKNDIELLCLPVHTSIILQPLDVGVFKAVKGAWRKCLREYYDESRYSNVDKRVFPGLLRRVVESGAISRSNDISAFEANGIFPLNREKINGDKLSTAVPLTRDDAAQVTSVDKDNDGETSGCHSLHSPETDNLTSSSCVKSPRKLIASALLHHLRQVTPRTAEKSRRVKRTLAECLTSPEVVKRMNGDTGGNTSCSVGANNTTDKAATTKDIGSSHGKVRCVRAKSKKPQKCQSSSSQRVQKCKKSATTLKRIPQFGNTSLEIWKPVWLTSGENTPEAQMTVAAATTKTTEDTEG